MAMTQVSAHQAMQSPYYGIKGWLLVIYVLSVLSMLSSVSNVISALMAGQAGSMGLTGVDPTIMAAMNAIHFVLALPFLILTPMKHRLMPVLTIGGIWIAAAMTLIRTVLDWETIVAASQKTMLRQVAAAGGQPLPTEFYTAMAVWIPILGIVMQIVFALMFTWYLLTSKRINATFRHRLPDDRTHMPATGIPSHG